VEISPDYLFKVIGELTVRMRALEETIVQLREKGKEYEGNKDHKPPVVEVHSTEGGEVCEDN